MSTIYALKSGQTVSFKLHTKLIPDIYDRVVVLGIVGHAIANVTTHDDINAIHSNIYGTLPVGTPVNAMDYDYLLVETTTGERKAVGIPWIIEPVEIIDQQGLRITIPKASNADASAIRNALLSRGIVEFEIETI